MVNGGQLCSFLSGNEISWHKKSCDDLSLKFKLSLMKDYKDIVLVYILGCFVRKLPTQVNLMLHISHIYTHKAEIS